MPYSAQDRVRIRLRAKRKLGKIKGDSQDKLDFMEECVDALDGTVDDAENVCQALWEEQGGSEGD